MTPLITWEKWIDPFGKDNDETRWNDYDDSEDDEDFNTIENENTYNNIINKEIRVIQSPMGLIPYNEHTAPGKIFNFWIGHTNFDITKSIINILEKIDGIEILDIFTRYRFRIAIGKCFNDSDVMKDITDKLYQYQDK